MSVEISPESPASGLRRVVAAALDGGSPVDDVFTSLARDGQLTLPLPGVGQTALRFDALQALGESDLTLARLAEAHADALAILTDLDGPSVAAGQTWGVWAAEPPNARVGARLDGGQWRLSGTKAWCSGAGIYSHALVTADTDEGSRLFALALDQPQVTLGTSAWATSALSDADTRSVVLTGAAAVAVGGPGDYVSRPGFWHGAVGVAAVWLGGATAVGRAVLSAARQRLPDDLGLSHLGAIDTALTAARSTLHHAAAAFDADPQDRQGRAAIVARRTRAVIEDTVSVVVDRAGRALGPAPLAMDAAHAKRVADLQLYVRQSHADRDLADLARRLVDRKVTW